MQKSALLGLLAKKGKNLQLKCIFFASSFVLLYFSTSGRLQHLTKKAKIKAKKVLEMKIMEKLLVPPSHTHHILSPSSFWQPLIEQWGCTQDSPLGPLSQKGRHNKLFLLNFRLRSGLLAIFIQSYTQNFYSPHWRTENGVQM